MKKIYFFQVLVTCLFMVSCDEQRIYTDGLDRYENIYMKQAAEYPNNHTVDIIDIEQVILFNACFGGYVSNDNNIYVYFDAMPEKVESFNEDNNTSYGLMPEDSYHIEEKKAIITSGKLNSNSLKLSLFTSGFMEPGQSYLLPVGITETDADAPVNEQLRITYFLFTGTYPLGKEPPVRVFDVSGKDLITLFTYQNFLVTLESNGLLNLFLYNTNSKSFNIESAGLNGGWNIFDKVMPSRTGFITRWAGSGLIWEYSVSSIGGISGDFLTKGSGFDIYKEIISSTFYNSLFCIKPTGELYSVQREGAQWSLITEIENGWEKYGQVLSYNDGLLAVDANGDLWFYPVKSDLTLDEKQHVGSGWDKYRRLFAFGTDLLAEDAEGIVWSYKFDLRGFWEVED